MSDSWRADWHGDDAEVERLVAEFRALVQGHADSGVADAESPPVDLVTLLTQLAALKNEVRIEARQFKEALDAYRGLADTLESDNRRLGEALERTQSQLRAAASAAERPLLLELIELRDRLAAAHASITAHRPGMVARLTGSHRSWLRGLGEGMAITLRRIDDAFARHGVEAIAAEGRTLDPHTMRVSAVGDDPAAPDGMVLAELRRGFVRGGEVLRTAEVRANRSSTRAQRERDGGT